MNLMHYKIFNGKRIPSTTYKMCKIFKRQKYNNFYKLYVHNNLLIQTDLQLNENYKLRIEKNLQNTKLYDTPK